VDSIFRVSEFSLFFSLVKSELITYLSMVWLAFQPTKIMAKYMAPMANTRWKKPKP
jgi:hypothetical protein